ncbi:major facilitator superfamily domain-containing protein [Xylariaceae sp. FL0016]|nr:major facilitator superfamily domain-containing protein [Xylariaceae sp. FL0016]
MSAIEEKKVAVRADSSSVHDGMNVDQEDISIDSAKERKLLWKIDACLVPLLTLSFLSAYLDRSNIGNAAISGMPEDLGMSSQQLANAILMFYVTVKKIRPSRLLPMFMLGWAVTTLGTGFMHTAPQLYASRLLIGLFEAGMYPALAITLTTFYTPQEQARRFAYLYLSVGLSGGFGGLFAYALLKLDGRHGIAGWRWLFIVEGALSIGIAALLWAFMPDGYENARFLTAEDKELMRLRTIKHERYMAVNEIFDRREVTKAFRDPKIWASALIQFLGDVLSFGVSTFMPALVRSFGFQSVLTQLLTVPIFFSAVAIFIALSIWSDKVQRRVVFMLPGALMCAVAYAMLMGIPMEARGALYFACFLVVPSIYIMLGMNYVWMLGSHAGYYKRATAIGINMTCGNAAGLVIGQIFKDKNSEGRYLVGVSVSLGCSLAAAVVCIILYFYLKRQNDERERLSPEERQKWIDEGRTGDAHPDYRFIL